MNATAPTTDERRMLELVRSFPALDHCTLTRWDPTAFERWVHDHVHASSSWHAALFVAGVWSDRFARLLQATAKHGRQPSRQQLDAARGFDLFAALRVWDDSNLRAALAWIQRPWFP